MGEYQIITSLARDFMNQGDSAYWASRNAVTEYKIALKEALEYEFEESQMYKKELKKNITEIVEVEKKIRKRGLIRCTFFKGTNKEKVLVREISAIMTEFGYLYGEALKDYIDGCIAIERNISYWIGSAGEDVMVNRSLFSKIDTDRVFQFLNKEVYRLLKANRISLC
jgi:hypothetical protein